MITTMFFALRWRHVAAVSLAVAIACGSDGDGGDTEVGSDDTSTTGDPDADPTAAGGGDGGPAPAPTLGDSECELAFAITGAVAWSTPSAPACAIPFGGDEGIWMNYLFGSSAVEAVEVDVEEVTEGATGAFPATVRIRHADGRRFEASECSVNIDSHVADPALDDEFSRAYVVHATGACAADAVDDDTAEAVTVAPFELSFPAAWAS